MSQLIPVKYVDLAAQWLEIRQESLLEIDRVLSSGQYLEHAIVEELETLLADYLSVSSVVTLNSGTDALLMALQVLGIQRGDEVITVPNSFIASVATIAHVGARPIFIDVGSDHLMDINLIEEKITPKTKAIMPVHLEGKMSNMRGIKEIANKYGLFIIEDAAQAIGSMQDTLKPGQLSDVACFSLHPLKNLNAIGDGGFIATNNYAIAERIRRLKNHGQSSRNNSEEFGFVSRLDSIQAAIVKVRLSKIDEVIRKRRWLASLYEKNLVDTKVKLPELSEGIFHTYHLYVIEVENRDLIQSRLSSAGIETRIHYPILISDQPAYHNLFADNDFHVPNAKLQSSKILSLPIHQHLTEQEIYRVSEALLASIE